MTQEDLFATLGAPLANVRWSWGAVRPADGVVVLRVWKDNVQTHNGREYVRIWKHLAGRIDPRDLGRRERLEHVGLIERGARCYLIMCEAADTEAKPRRVRTFDTREVIPGGAFKWIAGHCWIELLPGIPVADVASEAQRL